MKLQDPLCDTCIKALYKIGLARFSDTTLECVEQNKKWLKMRELILNNKELV